MCGLAARLSSTPTPLVTNSHALTKALSSLNARGPDDRRIWTSKDGKISLGHSRLNIIENAQQPLLAEGGTVAVIFNGEIYNYKKLLSNYRFSPTNSSDGNAILAIYLADPTKFLARLNDIDGEFAFVLCDSQSGLTIAGRDRYGIKPLAFSKHKNGIDIASEAKALFAMGNPASWNLNSLAHALTHQYLPMGDTLFANVSQIPPGEALIIRAGSSHLVKWERKLAITPSNDSPLSEQLKTKLSNTVKSRLNGAPKAACALSGGIDSASVAAIANSLQRNTPCFTVCFEDSSAINEARAAEKIASFIGADWHPVSVTNRDILGQLEASVVQSECLTINGQLPAKHLLSKAVHKAGYKTLLTGEGADEGLAGYAHLRADAGASITAACSQTLLYDEAPIELDALQVKLGFTPNFLSSKLKLTDFFRRQQITDVLDTENLTAAYVESVFPSRPAMSRLAIATELWSKTCMADYILRALSDHAEMAHSVEGRPVFLSPELQSWLRALPTSLRVQPGIEKQLLRTAMQGLLPDSALTQAKQPFVAPSLSRYDDKFVWEYYRDTLSSADTIPFIKQKAINRWLDTASRRTQQEKSASSAPLMLIISAIHLQKAYSL